MSALISDHVTQGLRRLLYQYRDSTRIKNLLTVLIDQVQDLEDTAWDVKTLRSIDTATGEQLDGVGRIVLVDRDGDDDDTYRLRIRAKVLVNISNGEPETLIQVYKLLTEANTVYLSEHQPAGVGLMSDGTIDGDDEAFIIWELLELAALGGVRVDQIGIYDETNAFKMDGALPGGGLGDKDDVSKGGKLSRLYPSGPQFALGRIGNNNAHGGLGSLANSAAGGRITEL